MFNISDVVDQNEKLLKDILPIFFMFTAIAIPLLPFGNDLFPLSPLFHLLTLIAAFGCCSLIVYRNHKQISNIENELEIISCTKDFILSEFHSSQQKNNNESENEGTMEDLKQVLILKEKVESLQAQLKEQEDIISKNKWKKWFIPACTAMGDIIRENTINSSHPIIIEKEHFFSRVISHYPNFHEIKNVKGEPFGSALRESWKCVPVTVKDMTGGSGRGKKASK